jgi:molybdopterin molybdotransferase
LEEAQNQILQHTHRLNTESISILTALGRIGATEVHAPADLPGRDQSAVDGYALCGLMDKYQLIGAGKPGEVPQELLQPGQAFAVSTGGNLPDGAMAVIPREKTEIRNNYLYPQEEIKPGNNIKQAGEDFPRGSLLINCGSKIGAAEISLFAAFGIANIEVYRQPRVAVLCLSKNIVDWQSTPARGQMRDSNGPLLSSLVIRDGGIPVAVYTTASAAVSLKSAAEMLLEQADVLIITGGTYADSENEACSLMKELGAEVLYWDVPVQPGSHTGFSVYKSRQIFALSGNPAACAVGYYLFVAPALKAMQGADPGLKRITAACSNGFPKKAGSRRFVRGHLVWTDSGWQVAVLPGQKPSMIRSLIQCNALIDIPAGSSPIEAGQNVSVMIIEPPEI